MWLNVTEFELSVSYHSRVTNTSARTERQHWLL